MDGVPVLIETWGPVGAIVGFLLMWLRKERESRDVEWNRREEAWRADRNAREAEWAAERHSMMKAQSDLTQQVVEVTRKVVDVISENTKATRELKEALNIRPCMAGKPVGGLQ